MELNLVEYKDKRIALIVGGEGGFSPKEVAMLDSIAKRVSLGKTILRAPVAVTSLYAIILAMLGNMKR